jgi:uncharacterized protein DUF6788
MSNKKSLSLDFDWPIIDGSVSSAMAKCGQKNCRCHRDPKAMHGPYYRWIGNVNGKKTTRTIDAKRAKEIQQWIKNHDKLQRKIVQMIKEALDSEIWRRDVIK